MYAATPVSRLILFLSLFWNTFLPWYLIEHPMVITKRYWQYACTFWEMFSFVFLVKTLFSPWKNITDEYPDKGFDLNLIFQAFTMNCITRCIGFVIRLSTLTFGIAVQLALLSIYVCYFLFWITFPFIVAIGGQFLIVTLLS